MHAIYWKRYRMKVHHQQWYWNLFTLEQETLYSLRKNLSKYRHTLNGEPVFIRERPVSWCSDQKGCWHYESHHNPQLSSQSVGESRISESLQTNHVLKQLEVAKYQGVMNQQHIRGSNDFRRESSKWDICQVLPQFEVNNPTKPPCKKTSKIHAPNWIIMKYKHTIQTTVLVIDILSTFDQRKSEVKNKRLRWWYIDYQTICSSSAIAHLICRSLIRNFEIFKAEEENQNGSQIAIALSATWLNNKNIHLLQKLPEYRDIVCCSWHGRGGSIGIYVREDVDVKPVLQKTSTVSEFITIKIRRNNGPPFLYQLYTPVEWVKVLLKLKLTSNNWFNTGRKYPTFCLW